MKRILFCVLLMLLLCGCEKTGPEYLVSSMGFDVEGDSYKVCFESVIINSENTEQTVRLLKGEGKTVKAAVEQIDRQCTQPLLLSHCGVLAIGDSVSKSQLRQIGDFCYSQEQVTLSAFFVRTENAEKLLSVKPVSSTCAGYDIMGLIKENKRYDNRLFEVINKDYDVNLPKISLKDGGLKFDGE